MQSRSSTELQRSRHGTPMLLSGLRPQHYKLTCRERPLVGAKLPFTFVSFCEGFRMTAHRDASACTGAVVRKPPVKERAGGWVGGRRAMAI
jgi:hypothetical protein